MLRKLLLLLPLLCIVFFKPTSADAYVFEDVIDNVNPSVVSVIVDLGENKQALGAGFVVDSAGYVVTNYHVTQGALKITLEDIFANQYQAKLVGNDKKNDISLLKINGDFNLPATEFADSDDVRVGNTVFAIGNPFGLGNSVSLGIISAKQRDIQKGPYDNFLQTDATINQGNSGGPLFDKNGKIIGMNTAIFSENGQYAGVGFATPSNTVQWVVKQLKKHGYVNRGWLGFSVKQLKSKTSDNNMLIIHELAENSPAAAAGLAVGDVIKALGEIPLDNIRVFSLEVSKLEPGTQIPMLISRDGTDMDFMLEVAKMPEHSEDDEFGLFEPKGHKDTQINQPQSFDELGIDKNLVIKAQENKELGISAYFDEKTAQMVIVTVTQGSVLQNRGAKIGDRIYAVNNSKIFGMDDFMTKIKRLYANSDIVLNLKSKDDIYTIVIKSEETNHE